MPVTTRGSNVLRSDNPRVAETLYRNHSNQVFVLFRSRSYLSNKKANGDEADVADVGRNDGHCGVQVKAIGSNGRAAMGSNGGATMGSNGGAAMGSNGGAAMGSNGGAAMGSNGGAAMGSNGGAAMGSNGGAAMGVMEERRMPRAITRRSTRYSSEAVRTVRMLGITAIKK
ncbi:hypothetical protein BC936DRAFT_147777 [Jimgerdemannia flammicorona]|uniref:Uncharacterized protein n=1 Tax=Jimgerdemannia flammicorona TaxID=994334 RepID=A0A433DLB3_9FUNG|nr:hypothetical protein BC936DRAFT_147777 [Jimgerdemannia flammicorona]